MTDPAPRRPPLWNLPAAIAAWLLPGLGHLLIGEVKRGIILATAIGTLWIGGLLVGGIGVVQFKTHKDQVRPWFLGQMLIAPSLVVEYTHDRYRAHYPGLEPTPDPDGPTLYEPSYGRPYEIGTLYTALAGLLNLLAIIDVAYREPRRAKPAATAPAQSEAEAA
ncbi:hypothetical protein OT109_11120 [Phycisphaeraceae bacterium D3-23]